jgi:hypothetical protein
MSDEARDLWQKGQKVRWARSLDQRPLAIVDLDHVTVAGRFAPLSITLQEVAGIFPIGWFDLADTRSEPSTVTDEGLVELLREALGGFSSIEEKRIREVVQASGHTALLREIEGLREALEKIASVDKLADTAGYYPEQEATVRRGIARAALSRPLVGGK